MGQTIPCWIMTNKQYYAVGTDKKVYRHDFIPKLGNWQNYCGGDVTLIEHSKMDNGKSYLFGLGTDKNIYMSMYFTNNESKSWRRITGDLRVKSFFADGKTIYALGEKNGAIYTCSCDNYTAKDVYCSAWKLLKTGGVSAFTVYGPKIYAVRNNKQVWTHGKNGAGGWSLITRGRIRITQVEVTHNTIYGLGVDTKVYHWNKRQWRPLTPGGVTQFVVSDTRIHGLNKDQQIYSVPRVSGADKWHYVTGPAVTHVARPFGADERRINRL